MKIFFAIAFMLILVSCSQEYKYSDVNIIVVENSSPSKQYQLDELGVQKMINFLTKYKTIPTNELGCVLPFCKVIIKNSNTNETEEVEIYSLKDSQTKHLTNKELNELINILKNHKK